MQLDLQGLMLLAREDYAHPLNLPLMTYVILLLSPLSICAGNLLTRQLLPLFWPAV